MKFIFIDYGLLQIFEYFLKSSLCYDNSKIIQKIHAMWLCYIYNYSVESFINLIIYT
jgi:hypothetical protein